jgi:hypothetical protein
MHQQIKRASLAGYLIFNTTQDERAAMPRLRRFHLIKRQPAGRDNPLVQFTLGLKTPQLAAKGKAQVSDILARMFPVINANQVRRLEMVSRLFQRLANDRLNQGLTRLKVTGRLIESQPGFGFFLDQQKFAVAHDDCGNGDIGFPDHGEAQSAMSMADRDGFIWQDGKLVPWREATTHVLTHSLHYGLAVFEGVRAYNTVKGTAIFRLAEHTQRLINSGKIYMMDIPYSKDELMEAQKEVVRANKLESCYLRPIAFYGSEKMGIPPKGATVHVAIAAWPWGAYLGEEGLEKGIRVKTSSYTRHHVNSTMPRAKLSGTYPNSILANLEVTKQGYDEALLLDNQGFVAEGRRREPLHRQGRQASTNPRSPRR